MHPVLGPGNPRELLATDLPMLVVQGGRDPYGTPNQFPALPPTSRLVEVPQAGHMFAVGPVGDSRRPPVSQVVDAVAAWLEHQGYSTAPSRH